MNRFTQTNQNDGCHTYTLKDGQAIPDDARAILCDLVSIDAVPANKVECVFKHVAGALGIQVEGDVSRRSVGRIVKEGGNAANLQFGQAVLNAKGVTISSDGTTHKNENYETKHATVIQENQRLQFFLGLKMSVNHTSETQFEGWTDTIEYIFHLLKESRMCSDDDACIFWNLVTGFHSDHAEDQKKLFRLLKKWKERCRLELLGECAVKRLTDLDYACLIFQGSQVLVQKAGGSLAWDALPEKERNHQLDEMRSQIIRDIGQKEYDKLSPEEKSENDLFLWAGCCMHKEMNAFKGGCVGLDQYWKAHPELEPLILLPNRDNDAAILKAAGTEAAKCAEERSEGGAIKVVSLAGGVFRHKDQKRGQQDTLCFYFDFKKGFILSFPDTSNTQFQSHAEACAVMITYLDLFIEFLVDVQQNKTSGKLNHMEQNVLNSLKDISTCHKICVITLYWQAISVPYMREICGPYAQEDNILWLQELHKRVIKHIDTLIQHPEHLIGPDASDAMGSLNGRAWEHPQAFYAVQSYVPELLHLRELLIYFMKASCVVWLRFMSEFEEGGEISCATQEQIDRAFMEKTNDLNEAAFGMYHQTACVNPTISLSQYNSRQMYKFNGTSDFLQSLSPEMCRWLRKITRRQDSSGINRQEKLKLAEHHQKVAEARTKKDQTNAAKRLAAEQEIDAIIPILTLTELESRLLKGVDRYLTVNDLTCHLKWHKKNGIAGAVTVLGGKRDEKIQLLCAAIERYLEARTSGDFVDAEVEGEEDHPEVTVEDLGGNSDGYDSEEEYYRT
ncbi:hypothetical protein F5890DRAFT_1404170 [Lentinula detonsa]|uniref:Uncharacterized protein n=1 Tax=Lentinula detonsa TaxID=2804962 RepID=A0AA38UV07_9AGAR|nr:hypothetical protein F5890DRAFT_1404170 [Lentinula detonsa]